MQLKRDWTDIVLQRKFLEEIALKFKIKQQNEWGKLTIQQIIKEGGSGLLFRYGNSLSKTLKNVYQELEWKDEWFRSRKKQNAKEFLLQLGKKLQIKNPSEWGKVHIREVIKEGGNNFLRLNRGSLFQLLRSTFPETEWKKEWFPRLKNTPSTIFRSKQETRKYLDILSKKLFIKDWKDWGKVSTRKLTSIGAQSLISKHGSLIHALKFAYPEVEWKMEWFSVAPGYWKKQEHHRILFDDFAKKLNIYHPRDWFSVSSSEIEKQCNSLLSHYGNSLKRALYSVYPEWDLYSGRKPEGYWNIKANQRDFMDKFAKKFQIKNPKEWSKITIQKVIENGGCSLLKRYELSLFKSLQEIYPEVSWKREWFHMPRFPKSFWNSEINQRNFLDQIANNYNIQLPSDWRRISSNFIRSKGGQGLLNKYNNSLILVLQKFYPKADQMKNANISLAHQSVLGMTESLFID